ncbi:MAG: Dabb family protein [Clostridia bacterium]|nr:Dabb family protein [Clostridia bacterium]
MVKHIILWKLNETLSESEKQAAIEKIKADLEALNGKIEGLISLTVTKADLPSSNADIMLDSSFVSEQALGGYQTHPLHIAAASFVRANTQSRLCADFNV